MLILDQLLVSEEIFEKKFVCNLSKCKGECCIAGDSGAPVKNEEIKQLEAEFENYRPYLTENGIKRIEKNGFTSYDLEDRVHKTMLLEEGPCAFINYDKKGVAHCGIEKAFLEGKSSFRKPISCHLRSSSSCTRGHA